MLRKPRTWLFAAGFWLIAAGLAHLGSHVWTYVLGNGMDGQRDFAMRAMQQSFSLDLLRPSLWRTFLAMSVSMALLFLFAGSVTVLLSWIRPPVRVLSGYALFSTVFWTTAFSVWLFVDPVIQPVLAAGVVVPVFGLAWMTAQIEPEEPATPTSAQDSTPPAGPESPVID